MQPADESWGNKFIGNARGTVVQARDIYYTYGTRPRQVSAKRFAAPDFADRDAELAEITAFCRDGGRPYWWWVGEPWSGKTALAAQVATSPPDGVDVVSFFVSRADGVHRYDSYVDAMTAQLGMGSHDLDELWEQAARRAAERGRTLLLIVDGLDENVAGDEPSIASQLPIDCPHGSHVLVTSRPHPDLPDDVRDSHPLRSCPRRTLVANSKASASQRAATFDLKEHLRDPTSRRVLGLLAVARGPLTAADLGAITGDFYETEILLTESMARLLKPGYTLAHETLLDVVTTRLGDHYLGERLDELHAWAAHHADWPDDTPAYLINSYAQLLVETSDAKRMAALCTGRRFRLLRALTGADHLTIRELRAARALQREVGPAARLAVWISVLNSTLGRLPTRLPALLVRHGRVAEAECVAHDLVDPVDRVCALADIANAAEQRRPMLLRAIDGQRRGLNFDDLLKLAEVQSSTEVVELAVRRAEQITDDSQRTDALLRCAWTAALVGTIDDVRRIDAAAGHADNATVAMAAALARAGRPAEAEELLGRLRSEPELRSVYDLHVFRELSRLRLILAYEYGRLGYIESNTTSDTSDDLNEPEVIMSAFARGAADTADDPDEVRAVLAGPIDAAHDITQYSRRTTALGEIAVDVAACGQLDLAFDVVAELDDNRSNALVRIERVLAEAGGTAEVPSELVDGIVARSDRVAALVAVGLMTGNHERSRAVLAEVDRLLAENIDVARAAVTLAALAAGHGRPQDAVRLAQQAEQLASRERDERVRLDVMACVIRVLTVAGADLAPSQQAWVAEAVDWLATHPRGRNIDYDILRVLAVVLPLVDDSDATRVLLNLGSSPSQEMVAAVAQAAHDAGHGALTAALDVPEPVPPYGTRLVIETARELRDSGANEEAQQALRTFESEVEPDRDRRAAVEIAIALGERHRAADLAAAERDMLTRLELLKIVAQSMLAAGETRDAEPLVVRLLAEGDTRILDLVAEIDPDAVPMLVNTFWEIVDYLGDR